MRPPAPSTSPAISPTPRVAVPLNSMCSWKCARPASSGPSSAEPTPAQTCTSATGARRASRSSTVTPEDSFSTRMPAKAGGAYPMACSRGWPRRRDRREALRRDGPLPRRLPARALLRARLPLLRLRGGGGAPARPRRRGALRGGAARGAGGARAALRRPAASRRSTSAAGRRRCCAPPRSRADRRGPARRLRAASRARSRSRPTRARSSASGSPPSAPRASIASRSACSPSTTPRCKRLGRAHRAEEAQRTLAAARAAGFDEPLARPDRRARPGRRSAALERDLDARARRRRPSTSRPTRSRSSPARPSRAAARPASCEVPDDDLVAEMLERTHARLEAAGLAALRGLELGAAGPRGAAQPALLAARAGARPRRGRPFDRAGLRRSGPFGARAANERSLAAWLARIEAGGGAAPPQREVLGRRDRARRGGLPRAAHRAGPRRRAVRRRVRRRAAAFLRRGDRRAARRAACSPRAPRATCDRRREAGCSPTRWLPHFVAAPVDSAQRA